MKKLNVPKTMIISDERKNLRVNDKYRQIEVITLFGVETEKSQSWEYYISGSPKDVVGIAYSEKSDLLEVILLPCSDEKVANSVLVDADKIIPALDAKYPDWREEELFVFNVVKRKKVQRDDFMGIPPQVMGKGDTVLLARRSPEGDKNPEINTTS